MIFTQTIAHIAGNQPRDLGNNDYLSFFNADIRENLKGFYVGNKWDNLFDLATLITGVGITKGANIAHAKIWVEDWVTSHPEGIAPLSTGVALQLSYQETDNTTVFSNADDFMARVKSPSKPVSKLNEMDITGFIREITSQPGWCPGNNICLFFEHDQAAWQKHYDLYIEDLSLSLQRDDFFQKDFKIEIEWCQALDSVSETFPLSGIRLAGTGSEQVNYPIGSEATDTFALNQWESQLAGYQPDTAMYMNPTAMNFELNFDPLLVGALVPQNTQMSMFALQFRGITIDKGAVSQATLRISYNTRAEPAGLSSLNVSVRAEAADSAADFADEPNFSARPKTVTASLDTLVVTVASEEWGEDHGYPVLIKTYHVALDVTSVVHETLNRPGWSSGNNLVLFIESAGVPGDYFQLSTREDEIYLDVTHNSAAEPPYTEYFQPLQINLAGSGEGAPGTRIHSFDPVGVAVDLSGHIHTTTTMVEPQAYTVSLQGVAPIEFETFQAPYIGLAFFMAGAIQTFDTTGGAGDVWVIYLGFLTGDKNNLEEIQIPLKSVQATLRTNAQSYLNVVTPAIDLAGEIAARKDGDIRVVMAQTRGGEVLNSEEIARVSLDYISTDEGTVNQSITLSGHRSESFTPKTIEVLNVSSQRTTNGKKRMRFPQPNMYLKPGDTVTSGNDSVVADQITLYISTENQQMEITEQ